MLAQFLSDVHVYIFTLYLPSNLQYYIIEIGIERLTKEWGEQGIEFLTLEWGGG